MHEENSVIDSRLTKEGRKVNSTIRHWKEGWADEIESKFSRRCVSVMNECQKAEVKTKNKLMMEHAIEHVVYIKESKDDLRKINKVRKCERVIFPFELLGSNGVKLKIVVKMFRNAVVLAGHR